MIFAPFIVLLMIFIAVAVSTYVIVKKDVLALQSQTLSNTIQAISYSLADTRIDTRSTAMMVNEDYQELYEYIANEDLAGISDEFSFHIKTSRQDGYAFLTVDGRLLSHTEGEYNLEQLKKYAEMASEAEEHVVSGSDVLLGNSVCEFTACQMFNNEKEFIGTVFIVGMVISDEKTIERIKTEVGSEVLMFDREKCIGTTLAKDKGDIVLDPIIRAEVFDKGERFVGKSDMLGSDGLYAALPLKSPKGEVVACVLVKSDTSITDKMLGLLYSGVPVVVLIVLVISVMLFRDVMYRIIMPIGQLDEQLQVIATGDMRQTTSVKTKCKEILSLEESVAEMQNKIRGIIRPIQEANRHISSSASMLSTSSENLSNASNRQAASLEEISSAMEEMNANIQQNTDNSIQTNKVTEEVSGLIGSMNTSSSNSYEAIKNIAEDISAINDLVSQTNILALNASVEAARAGEAGKGFAVVAKEVGRLADQTKTTADGITETSTACIQEAEVAYNYVQQVLPKIEKIVKLVKEITAASVEQNAGVGQVNEAIIDLNKVTQENAAGSEEIAASARDLKHMIDDMNKAMNVFKV